jgi:hypothetical protein
MILEDRLRKDILDSECFDRCRRSVPNYDQYVKNNVIAVSGDVVSSK